MSPSRKRLNDAREAHIPWKKWGPYLSERQWGTVREDYSDDGNAWDYFTHDQARSRAYRWGEDGLGGLCDDKQRLCFALALWNERDPILKERLFGLTNSEANHGEDVKEYYFYIDSTPTHSYMKYLYKYPQREYPYRDLIDTNRRRSREEFEYELLDTGAFGENRYFDVFVEYAKDGPEDILVRITVHNRGPEAARLRVLPTLWFRNTWSWDADQPKPSLREAGAGSFRRPIVSWASIGCNAMALRSCSSPRTKATPAGSGVSPTRLPTSRTRSTSASSRVAATRSTLPRSGRRRPRTMSSTCPPGEARPSVSVWLPPATEKAFGGFDKIFKSRIADVTISTIGSRRRR